MTPRPSLRTAVLAAAALLAAPLTARADFITLQYGYNGVGAVNPTVTNSLQSNAPTGPFYWHDNNLPPSNFPTPTATFCIELTPGQFLPSIGQNVVFNAQSLASAPTIGTTAKADAITELYGRYYNTAWATPSTGASNDSIAFQLALWELVYDGKPAAGNTTDLSNGTFNLSSSVGTPYTTAQTWLNSLNGNTSSFSTRFAGQELVALVAPAPGAKQQDQVQDQIAIRPTGAVPAPPGVVLAAIGLVGLIGRRRLTRKPATV